MRSKPRTSAPRAADDPGRIDLHLHTDRSDGRFPPDDVLARAFAGRLDLLAVADHDLPNVLPAGLHERDGRTLRLVAAAEISGHHDGREFHLLVYFPGEMPEDFRAFLRARARARAVRYDAAVAKLGLPGLPPADDDARDGARSLTRHHLYAALKAARHVRDMREGFQLLGGSAVVPLIDLPYVDAIRIAREAGGLTSWAHPGLLDAQAHLATFVRAGLEGIEGVRPRLDRKTRNGLRSLAEKHGLLLTGGSDWHGWTEPPLGTFAVTGERARDFVARLDRAA
jgi:predicted metal-dependent phosphoesterase TrpH